MGGHEYGNIRFAGWLSEGWHSSALVNIIKEDKMELEQLEFVREVLDDTLVSGEVNSDRILIALEIIADEIDQVAYKNSQNEAKTDDNEVQSIGSGPDADSEACETSVQEDGPHSGANTAEG